MLLILLIFIIGSATAIPRPDTRSGPQERKTLFSPARNRSENVDENSDEMNGTGGDARNETPSVLRHHGTTRRDNASDNRRQKAAAQGHRKHKAVFVDYPAIPRVSPYPRAPTTYEIGYNDDDDDVSAVAGGRTSDGTSRGTYRQDSDIFYIRLPPAPYVLVPGVGYISQPPTYSTAVALKPQSIASVPVAQLPQLLQLPSYVRPARPPPQTTATTTTTTTTAAAAQHHQTANPFIKLPVDFVSNGKPTTVYQWYQKKPAGKKPADSPITKLDSLSSDFVSNGKPTSIYQWQANFKPAKRRPDDSLNSLDMGPYTFNGKLTSLYLLGSDGSSSMHQSIRYSDYQDDYRNDYRNAYY